MTLLLGFLYIRMCLDKYSAGMFGRTLVTLLLCVVVYYFLDRFEGILGKVEKWIVLVFLAVMLALQIFFGYWLEITPNWDFGSVYYAAVSWVDNGNFLDYQEYYYWYPNNLGELGVLAFLFRIAKCFGIHEYYRVATVVNALCNVLMMWCVSLICKRLLGVKNSLFSLFIFMISIPSYFGAAVFYTDVFSMLYPVLFFYLYLRLREAKGWKSQVVLSLLMALTAWVGCEIKYTVLIMVIAVGIELLLRLEWKRLLLMIACMVVVFMAGNAVYHAVLYPKHFDEVEAKKKNTPVTHWIMMSMQGDGGYDGNDTEYTRSYSYTDDSEDPDGTVALQNKKAAIREVLFQRMSDLGAAGVLKLFLTKAEKCFCDGTYDLSAFFYHGLARECRLDPYVTSTGESYESYRRFCTGVYFGFFVLMVIGGGIRVWDMIRQKQTQETYRFVAPMLAVLGIVLFLMIWETAPRYMVNFMPMIYICAVFGIDSLWGKVKLLKK
jgi:hypothetical protein